MEYILINESKIKIICEEKDLELYGINAEDLEYGDTNSRKFIDSLLEEAKEKFGFETVKHRVLIQLFPSNDGGCEIFISKLGLLNKKSQPSTAKEELPPQQKNKTLEKLFFFEKLDFMLEACKRLSFLSNKNNSSAFYIDGTGYYLYIEVQNNDSLEEYGIISLDEYSFLLEYGEPVSTKEKLPYLKEYAKNICKEKAIEKLGII